jgi:hypothetical protein
MGMNLKNKASGLTDGTMDRLNAVPLQDNHPGRREIPGTGFLERAEGLWYDSTILKRNFRS